MTSRAGGGGGSPTATPYQSYQNSPPGKTYAEQQTNVLQDTVKTQYEADSTAANVLSQMHQQRQQLQGTRDDVMGMRTATAQAKQELTEIYDRNRRKKRRLYFIIAVLSIVDLALIIRIIQCHGSFFC
eukprot:CAMPEP_0116837668 /NCGR_PEP_ID=MMETSP0418-20121206/8779_1 /TAXON_ID=1158023 /ORGANISM="Astrosyne radiata, Strain 13vi08-1A" /LENGTH=127 /DNA_ID=CAMNT_0004467573 /DNA_START=93 /DNA_END=476 /DNA_ORIENTATION=-